MPSRYWAVNITTEAPMHPDAAAASATRKTCPRDIWSAGAAQTALRLAIGARRISRAVQPDRPRMVETF